MMTLRKTSLIAAAALAASSLVPAVAAAQPTTTVVTSTDDSYEWNAPVFMSGLSTFAVSYGAAVIVAASTSTQANQRLYVPIAGPWLDLNDRSPCDISKPSCDNETTAKVLLVVDGIFQAASVLTMVDGLLLAGRHHGAMTAERKGVHFTPTTYASVGGSAPGFAMLGSF